MDPPDIRGESVPSGLPEPSPPNWNAVHAAGESPSTSTTRELTLAVLKQSIFLVLQIYWAPAKELFSTVCQPNVSQEFMTLMEDKFTDNSSLVFYKQNLYEYEQGTAAAVVKGRLRVHLLFWAEIGAPPWVIETIRSGYVVSFLDYPSRCLLV